MTNHKYEILEKQKMNKFFATILKGYFFPFLLVNMIEIRFPPNLLLGLNLNFKFKPFQEELTNYTAVLLFAFWYTIKLLTYSPSKHLFEMKHKIFM